MVRQYKKFIIALTSWSSLGFYRGVQNYNYFENKYNNNKNYMYSKCFVHGTFGALLYYVPLCWPFLGYKELNRAEICIRSLEKNDDYYSFI